MSFIISVASFSFVIIIIIDIDISVISHKALPLGCKEKEKQRIWLPLTFFLLFSALLHMEYGKYMENI